MNSNYNTNTTQHNSNNCVKPGLKTKANLSHLLHLCVFVQDVEWANGLPTIP